MASAVTTGSLNEASRTLACSRRMRPDGSKVAWPKVTETPDSARWSSISRSTNCGTGSTFTEAM